MGIIKKGLLQTHIEGEQTAIFFFTRDIQKKDNRATFFRVYILGYIYPTKSARYHRTRDFEIIDFFKVMEPDTVNKWVENTIRKYPNMAKATKNRLRHLAQALEL